MTDKDRLLQFFRSNPNREVNAYLEIVGPEGLRILEYTGRISDVREDLGCTCGQDQNSCTASEHIQNTRKGYYRFVTKFIEKRPVSVPLAELEAKRQALRAKYVEARANKDEMGMKIIEAQGRAVKNAIDLHNRTNSIMSLLS